MSSLRKWRIPPLAIVLEAFKLLALFIVASYWSANSEFLNAIIFLPSSQSGILSRRKRRSLMIRDPTVRTA
jgi:hypothetical protein